ncbi:hypothetical protein QFC21_006129 [Naganishia friedmannii]|uniref:Uncharacterized protein n=1 Tax=Naganishia friedmannii TaxID=89922 RepID=A0ACC2V3W0_9TREE|nr:hypothetical protein QFC21_006129 [Naganishia friedmannii]
MIGNCKGCGHPTKGQNSSNFINRQRTCPGLLEASRKGMPGIMCDVPGNQSTFESATGALILPFNQQNFLAAVMKWIIVSGLPFTTIQNRHLQAAFHLANPDAKSQSARSLARKLESSYDIVNERFLAAIRSEVGTIHYSHDSWTDSGRKNSYFGIYVSFVNDQMEYKEVLLRLLHMHGSHSGERMGDGMFDLFHKVAGISGQLGPGTADNAFNNLTAAERLATIIRGQLHLDYNAKDFVGCVAHIANLIAQAYLGREGQDAFHNPELEPANEEDEAVPLEDQEVVDEQEDSGEDTETDDEDDEESGEITSPLDEVHRLAVHDGTPRRPQSHGSYGCERQWLRSPPEQERNVLVSAKDFAALEIIQPTLKIFLNLTLVHSEVGANAHRIIPDLVNALDDLVRTHDHPSVTHARKESCDAAVDKLKKYLFKFIKNK